MLSWLKSSWKQKKVKRRPPTPVDLLPSLKRIGHLCYVIVSWEEVLKPRKKKLAQLTKMHVKPNLEIEMFLENDERSKRIVNWVLKFFLRICCFHCNDGIDNHYTTQGQQKCNLEMLWQYIVVCLFRPSSSLSTIKFLHWSLV